tara:strand:+ start:455 stop:688 length:234 start_codon:yes stop_codon:yes gene_type:complete
MSEVQIVYLTVDQIYQLESLAEKELERLQNEIEYESEEIDSEFEEEAEDLEGARKSLYDSRYFRHLFCASDFERKTN